MFNRLNQTEKFNLANRMKILWVSNKGILNSAQNALIESSCFVNRSMERVHEKTTFLESCLQCFNVYDDILKFMIRFKVQNNVFFNSFDEYKLFDNYLILAYFGFNSENQGSILGIDSLSKLFYESFLSSYLGKKYKLGSKEYDTCNFFHDFISYMDTCLSEMLVGRRGIETGENYQNIQENVTNGCDILKSFFNVSCSLTLTCGANEEHKFVKEFPNRYGLKLAINDCFYLTNGFDCSSNSFCELCQENVNMRREINIIESSECLLIALKRFDVFFNFETVICVKLF